MAAKAIVDALPFPLKDLSWERVPEVAAATGFGFTSVCDLLKLVIGEAPSDIVPRLNLCMRFCMYLYILYIYIYILWVRVAVFGLFACEICNSGHGSFGESVWVRSSGGA